VVVVSKFLVLLQKRNGGGREANQMALAKAGGQAKVCMWRNVDIEASKFEEMRLSQAAK